jgi:Domain of unknown function (DUF305)
MRARCLIEQRMSGLRRSMVLLILAPIGLLVFAHYRGMTLSYGEDAFHASMMESMARMRRDMQNASMTGDPDHDFAAMMIPHHQGAIDMAKAELLYGKDPRFTPLGSGDYHHTKL